VTTPGVWGKATIMSIFDSTLTAAGRGLVWLLSCRESWIYNTQVWMQVLGFSKHARPPPNQNQQNRNFGNSIYLDLLSLLRNVVGVYIKKHL